MLGSWKKGTEQLSHCNFPPLSQLLIVDSNTYTSLQQKQNKTQNIQLDPKSANNGTWIEINLGFIWIYRPSQDSLHFTFSGNIGNSEDISGLVPALYSP